MKDIQEGAINNDGLFWLDRNANLLPVPTTMSHEEYAQTVLNDDLENLFRKGFVRIQSIPQYLLIDLRKKPSRNQSETMLGAFKDKHYGQIIVSRKGSDYENFKNVVSAIEYAETGRLMESAQPKGPFSKWIDRHNLS